MISITNDVTFIENGDSADALTIIGGEKYHTHTRAVSTILHLVTENTNLNFGFVLPSELSPEGKLQFKINGTQDSSVSNQFNLDLNSDDDGEIQIYTRFAEKLKKLLQATNDFHLFYRNEEMEDAIKLNEQFNYKLEKVAHALFKIERDLVLIFHTEKPNQIAVIKATKLIKLRPLRKTVKHTLTNILIDEFAKHNKAGTITVSLIDASTFAVIGSKITIREELISLVDEAYLNSSPVNITVLNKDKVAPNKCRLSGEIIEIEESETLLNDDEGESF
jgi:hypothetical protein